MAFRRFRRYRRYRGRKRRWGGRRYGRGRLSKRIARIGRGLKNLKRHIEYKIYDSYDDAQQVLNENGHSWSFVNDIVQGTDYNQRIGRQILVHRIAYSGYIRVIPNGTPTDITAMENVRHLVYLDRQPDASGAAPSAGQLFELFTNQDVTDAFRNIANMKYYKMIKDKVYRLRHPYSNSGMFVYSGVPGYKYFKINVKFRRPIKVTFVDDDQATQQIAYNDIIAAWFGPTTSTVADEFFPQLTHLTARTVYSDC